MTYYFAYGSNMSEPQMKERCPDSRIAGKGLLRKYRLAFTRESSGWGCGVADIAADSHSEVWGLLYEVSDLDLEQLDRYEGHPTYYVRNKVKIETPSGKTMDAISYEVVDKQHFVPPSNEYLNIIKSAAQKHGFPGEYQDYLNNIKTQQ